MKGQAQDLLPVPQRVEEFILPPFKARKKIYVVIDEARGHDFYWTWGFTLEAARIAPLRTVAGIADLPNTLKTLDFEIIISQGIS